MTEFKERIEEFQLPEKLGIWRTVFNDLAIGHNLAEEDNNCFNYVRSDILDELKNELLQLAHMARRLHANKGDYQFYQLFKAVIMAEKKLDALTTDTQEK